MTDDICSNHHGGADTSVAANPDQRTKVWQRIRVLRAITRAVMGRTCDEVEVDLCMRHQTCSARITELKKAGLIEDTGQRRATRSGRSARVYKHTKEVQT